MIDYIIAVCIVGYALFASLMWWTKASDCKYTETLNKNLHDMLDEKYNQAHKYRERILELESAIEGIGKLCKRKDGK